MKKLNVLLLLILISSPLIHAGGLVTNTNQSAAWARTLTRQATLGVDAVYFNPAGLAQLSNGLHLSLSNQTILQTRTITSNYPLLTSYPDRTSYGAELTAPFFPSIYAAFKMGKLTFSGGFNIIGGGGSADFKDGIPSLETQIASVGASLIPLDQTIEALTTVNPGFSQTTGYNIGEMSLNGSSRYMGFQVGATYAINDMISVAIGARYVSVNNSYEGHTDGITINTPAAYGGLTMPPGDYLRFIDANVPLPPAEQATLLGTAAFLDGISTDGEVNTVQEGSGFTPIIGVNLHLTDIINIAARYEHHTKIELENATVIDDLNMFPNGEKTRADLPGMFTLGARIQPIKKLTASVGFDYYLDKTAYYGNKNDAGEQINNETTIDNNAYTISGSLEYKLLGILGLSAGFSTGNLGVNDNYQSDLSYSQKSNTVAGGVFVNLGKLMTLNAGVVYVMYDDYEKSYTAPFNASSEIYSKNTTIFAVGLDISLGR